MANSLGNLRIEMPQTAAVIDALRTAFGEAQINDAIRTGIDGSGCFYASENGREVGSLPIPAAYSVTGDALLAHLVPKQEKN